MNENGNILNTKPKCSLSHIHTHSQNEFSSRKQAKLYFFHHYYYYCWLSIFCWFFMNIKSFYIDHNKTLYRIFNRVIFTQTFIFHIWGFSVPTNQPTNHLVNRFQQSLRCCSVHPHPHRKHTLTSHKICVHSPSLW